MIPERIYATVDIEGYRVQLPLFLQTDIHPWAIVYRGSTSLGDKVEVLIPKEVK